MTTQPFDGETFDEARDGQRLFTQLDRVRLFMSDGKWTTLLDLAEECGGSEASVSARLRDLRKPRFGGHKVERRYVANGLYEYRLVPRAP